MVVTTSAQRVVVSNPFSSTVRRRRRDARAPQARGARAFGIATLFMIVAGLVLAPIASATADPTDTVTQPADTAPVSTTTPPVDTPTTTAPSTTTTTTPPADAAPPADAVPAAPAPGADDGDGVPADVERAAPHGGDNNEDGIADAEQANVASLPASNDVNGNGVLDDYVSLVSPVGTTLHDVRAVAVPTDPAPPADSNFLYGLFDYTVHVASSGDRADVTYVLPSGPPADSVFTLQDGTWTDVTAHSDIEESTNQVTLTLQDGATGDADQAANGVIDDPSGISVGARTIMITDASGAAAPSATFRLERCSQTSGSSCTSATPVGIADGAANANGDSGALANGQSWYWGGLQAGQLEYGRNYRLTVQSAPAGWTLNARNCNPQGSFSTTGGDATANGIIIRLSDADSQRRAGCSFSFNQANAGELIVRKAGDRAADGSIASSGVAGATFSIWTNSSRTIPANPATCGPTDANGQCSVQLAGGTYYLSETTPPPSFLALPQLATDADGTGAGTNRDYSNIGPVTVTNGQTTTIPNNTGLSASDYNYNSGRYTNSRSNPALPPVCGLNVGLVMDLSGSIDSGEFTQMKTAANDFVTSLTGTPSKVAVYSFATDAPASGNTNLAATSVASASGGNSAQTVKDKINGLSKPSNPNYYTNWDAAFRSVGSGHDLVLILTDGNPTVDGTGSVDTSNISTNFLRIEAGIASANQVKTLTGEKGGNTRIVGVGIGIGANSVKNLAAVSGPTAYSGANAATADYFTTGFDTLGDTLAQIAKAQCAGTVSVVKEVQTGSGVWAPASGWQFGTSPVASTSNPANGQTDGNGAVSFSYSAGPWPKSVSVFETQQTGYSLVQQGGENAACTRNGVSIPGADVSPYSSGNNVGVTISVSQLDTIACKFRNTPTLGSIQVRKQTLTSSGGPFTFTLTGPNGTNASYSNVNTASANTPVTAGTASNLYPGQYVATETSLPAGWTLDSIDCGSAVVDLAGKKATITVPATGGATVCTFTNKPTTGSIQLDKKWSGALSGDAPTATLQIGSTSGGTNVASQPVTGPADGSTGAKTVVAGTYYVQEAGLSAGWSQTALTCSTNGGSAAAYVPADGIAVPSGGAVVCAVTNTRQKGTIKLDKVWTGGVAGETPGTTLQIGTTSGGTQVATQAVTGLAAGSTGVKNVGVGTYYVSETGLGSGWSQGSLTCSIDGGAATPYVPASGVAVANGKNVVCTVTNTRDTGTIQLDKKWSGALSGDAPTVTLQIGSGSGGTNVASQPVTGPSDGSTGAKTVASGTYFVQESGLSVGWLQTALTCSTNGGTAATYVPANGIAVPKNGTVVCSVTNTRQKGSIQLDKKWSGALSGDAPTATLQIGSGSGGTNVANEPVTGPSDGSTGAKNVGIGTYFVQESGVSVGWLQTALTCSTNGGAAAPYVPASGVTVANGASVVCTVTNARQKGTVKLDKVWSGGVAGETPGTTLRIGTSTTGSQVSSQAVTGLANGSTGVKNVGVGTYFVSESGLAAGWGQTSLTCQNGLQPPFVYDAQNGFPVANGDSVVCTLTNTRNVATVTVNKTWVGGVAGETPGCELEHRGAVGVVDAGDGSRGGDDRARSRW